MQALPGCAWLLCQHINPQQDLGKAECTGRGSLPRPRHGKKGHLPEAQDLEAHHECLPACTCARCAWNPHRMHMLLQTPVQPEVERMVETIAAAPSASLNTASVMASTDEEDMTQEAKQCVQALREGKR